MQGRKQTSHFPNPGMTLGDPPIAPETYVRGNGMSQPVLRVYFFGHSVVKSNVTGYLCTKKCCSYLE
jgi:hypothetical protein